MFTILGIILLFTKNVLAGKDMGRSRERYRKIPRVDFSKADELQKTVARFTLFTNDSVKNGKVLTEESVRDQYIDKNIPTVLIMHGWTTNDSSPWYAPLKEALFKSGPHNVFYLDWSIPGNRLYGISCANTVPMGKIIAEFFIASGIPPNKIHLVGHSLGSQLASFIGKSMYQLTGKKIGRITALDPAGPAWENKYMDPQKEKLCPNDAEFVDVIHTDIYYSGYIAPCGHVDFYPNGGRDQPGCPQGESDENCSHARATLFFIESVLTKVNAMEVDYTEVNFDVVLKKKENAKEIVFGYHTDTSARGVYTLKTNSDKPFLK